jgi:hypothetical protein
MTRDQDSNASSPRTLCGKTAVFRAGAKGQRQDRYGSESGMLAQHVQPEADIL